MSPRKKELFLFWIFKTLSPIKILKRKKNSLRKQKKSSSDTKAFANPSDQNFSTSKFTMHAHDGWMVVYVYNE